MIWVYALCSLVILLMAWRSARRLGENQTIPFSVCIALLVIYCVFTPLYFYLTGRKTILGDEGLFLFAGKDITNYYEKGMLFYLIANTSFVLGFLWKRYSFDGLSYAIDPENLTGLRRKAVLLYAVFFAVVVTDIAISGINPWVLLTGHSDENLFGHQSITNSYYFRNCADSVITTIILYAYFKGKPGRLILLIIPAFVLFAIMGFRYRIILTILGLMLIYSANVSVNIRKWFLIGFSVMYFIFFITYNRWNFIAGRFYDLTYNPVDFNYEMFFEQTHQALNDFNLIRYYEENPSISYDYGLTMFGYIFIKAMPKFLFKNGEKPYPPPALAVISDSLELPPEWPKTGETTMHYGEFFGTLGWFGAVVMPFLMGFLIHYFSSINPASTPSGLLRQIALSLALFVFITRGYFPQFIDNLVYISVPIWLLSRSIKKASVFAPYSFSDQ